MRCDRADMNRHQLVHLDRIQSVDLHSTGTLALPQYFYLLMGYNAAYFMFLISQRRLRAVIVDLRDVIYCYATPQKLLYCIVWLTIVCGIYDMHMVVPPPPPRVRYLTWTFTSQPRSR